MGAFEYLLLLGAVILALAISDLAVSTHRLLNGGARVRWDALPVLAAMLAFERIVVQWWTWHGGDHLAAGMTFGMFIGILLSALLLFLMAAVALPDDTNDIEIDLRAHYARVSRRYWILFCAQWLTLNIVSTWAQLQILHARLTTLVSPAYLIFGLGLLLAIYRNRLLHAIGLVGFIVFYTAVFFNQALG